jgi:hypothetical protein
VQIAAADRGHDRHDHPAMARSCGDALMTEFMFLMLDAETMRPWTVAQQEAALAKMAAFKAPLEAAGRLKEERRPRTRLRRRPGAGRERRRQRQRRAVRRR